MTEQPPDTVQVIGAKITFVPMDAAAGYELTEWDVEPGTPGPPLHIHHEHDEGFYVMTGRFAFMLDSVTTYATPGAYVLVPKGHEHSFWNAGARPARLLLISSPRGLGEYFRALAAGLRDNDTQDDSIALRKKLGEKYDVEVTAKPPSPPGA